MRKYIINGIVLVGFLITTMIVVDFEIVRIFNLRVLLAMVLGTTLLTIASSWKSHADFKTLFAYQVVITSIFTTTLLFIKEFSRTSAVDFYSPLQPILYGILIYLIGFVYYELTHKQASKQVDEQVLRSKYNLSDREIMIARELLKGKSNAEIAGCLFIAESTVKKHIQHIYKKTEVTSRGEFKKIFHE
ncbi:helix-turn-helix transcriptional regulator [Acidaminobacter sp. JC074]|uniref:response regulator transcription factor n=1 Tax=Acidaminobacter sp. JC074 TaxID=2530199 RepID=UPI001F0F79C3|nr:helix-turn-helix transcriptional regulator [Acidaminobacter sp. JC074]MCH4889111.1 helix-turn-helix transcriptional regulator [Acidaminobacter sp. JC074]